jgi:signal transduction histidine kinase/ligand-binding sensor domain-containing protein/FixJ family two-component response regulator/HPt (histidine-containing phosphotransfer) domain-containing protein
MRAFGARTFWLALLQLAAVVAAANEDSRSLRMQHLNTVNGLPQGTVMATLQDSQGFIWLGTEDGLVRYDGEKIRRYAYSRGSKVGLPGNFIRAIAEDSRGDIWVAVKDRGIAKWERDKDSFVAFQHDPARVDSLGSDTARALLFDRHGDLWVATVDSGVDVLSARTGKFSHYRHDAEKSTSISSNNVNTLSLDSSGNILIGTDQGVDQWQPDTKDFISLLAPESLSSTGTLGGISAIAEDVSRKGLWVGTFESGLIFMERTGKSPKRYQHSDRDSRSLASNDVRAITVDVAGHVWVGTAAGLSLFNAESEQFSNFRHDPADADSLANSFVMSLYSDSQGMLWIGTRAGGVDRWNPQSWRFGGYRPAWLAEKLVTSFAEDVDGRVWVGAFDAELRQLDLKTGNSRSVRDVVGHPSALDEKRVMSLLETRDGALWVGTMMNGIVVRDRAGSIRQIVAKANDPRALSAAGIMRMYEARDGRIWIGTHGGGANIYDPKTKSIQQLPFSSLPYAAGSVSSANVSAFAEDQRGNMWIATDGGGLNLATQDGSVIKVYRHNREQANSISSNTIYSLAVDQQGTVWVATDGGGLDQVIWNGDGPQNVSFKSMSLEDGLSSSTVYGILVDDSGALWLSGNAGLMRVDPGTSQVRSYHQEHGLQGEEFNFNAYLKTRSGVLLFGGPGGFNAFLPQNVQPESQDVRIALTNVEIVGKPLQGNVPYWSMRELTLDHKASVVSLDFATLDFMSAKRRRLEYRIEGLTNDWIDLGSQSRLTLTNLAPGKYFLEVRGEPSATSSPRAPIRILIHKAHGPWTSPFAYALYALAVVAIIMLRLRHQQKKLDNAKLMQLQLEGEVQKRTADLRESNRHLEEAARAKEGFLARMSHELRTPMNGVIGMTELLTHTPLTPTQLHYTQTIRGSAQSLLAILNDLLDLSKIGIGKIELESVPLDVTQIMEEAVTLFATACREKGVDLILCPPDTRSLTVHGDPLRLRQIVLNLLGNAVKFTHRGSIVVRADIRADADSMAVLQMRVVDTGIGIEEEVTQKIFQPFVQADESTSRKYGGTGLGLSICKELAALMHGSVCVTSELGKGSEFCVTVRVKTQVSKDAEASLLPDHELRLEVKSGSQVDALRRYAKLSGIAVEGSSGVSGVKKSRQSIHLIDLDDGLPDTVSESTILIASGAAQDRHRDYLSRTPHLVINKPVLQHEFQRVLSLSVNRHESVAMEGPAPQSLSDRAAHILVVDDEPINAIVARGFLEQLGYSSDWAQDATAALQMVAAHNYDLVFMDINMPGMDGAVATAAIRELGRGAKTLPIVALTALEGRDVRDRCLTNGMNDVLSKPCSLDELRVMVAKWVRPGLSRHGQGAQQTAADDLALIDSGTVDSIASLSDPTGAALYPKLVELFVQSLSEGLVGLEAAIANQDEKAAAFTSHKLKSAAANVGALQYSKKLAEIERLCKRQQMSDAGRCCAQLRLSELRVVSALRQYSERQSA